MNPPWMRNLCRPMDSPSWKWSPRLQAQNPKQAKLMLHMNPARTAKDLSASPSVLLSWNPCSTSWRKPFQTQPSPTAFGIVSTLWFPATWGDCLAWFQPNCLDYSAVMDGSLPRSLKHIISNAEYYGPSLFLLGEWILPVSPRFLGTSPLNLVSSAASDVVTVYVFQEPSMLSSLQDNGLTDVVLHALLVKDVSPLKILPFLYAPSSLYLPDCRFLPPVKCLPRCPMFSALYAWTTVAWKPLWPANPLTVSSRCCCHLITFLPCVDVAAQTPQVGSCSPSFHVLPLFWVVIVLRFL